MQTGWRAARKSRRAHTRSELKKHPPTSNVAVRRRRSVKDSNSAMRMKGLA